uniref:Uncharacterized protein n=1 Tax=Loxodonta africana TaxID=9785 RepID=G3UGV1_LOXAF
FVQKTLLRILYGVGWEEFKGEMTSTDPCRKNQFSEVQEWSQIAQNKERCAKARNRGRLFNKSKLFKIADDLT